MTCNAIYRQRARIKSKTSVAQTASQAAVYVKGLSNQIRIMQGAPDKWSKENGNRGRVLKAGFRKRKLDGICSVLQQWMLGRKFCKSGLSE
jgi:hypothetical protein